MSDKEIDFPVLLAGDILRYESNKGKSTYLVMSVTEIYRLTKDSKVDKHEAVLFSLEKTKVSTYYVLNSLNHIQTFVYRDGNVIYED